MWWPWWPKLSWKNAIQRVFLVCLTKWSSRSLMAGVLTAAKLGVGLGAAFLFQRRNLGSWKFGLGALSSVALCLYWFVLERTLSVATRNFEIGVFVIFYLVFGFGPKVLALDLHRKHTAVLCKFVRINFQVFYGVTFIWVMEWCFVDIFCITTATQNGFQHFTCESQT